MVLQVVRVEACFGVVLISSWISISCDILWACSCPLTPTFRFIPLRIRHAALAEVAL